jgi:actin-related protein
MHEIAFHSIMKCDPDSIKDLSSNIVLTGGSTSFPGTLERLAKEVFYNF